MGNKAYVVYILASRSRVLYTGVTSRFETRLWEHRLGTREGFSKKYFATRLVYYEVHGDPRAAIAREKQIKAWRRSKKVALINATNPKWLDLSEEWLRAAKTTGPSSLPAKDVRR